MLRHNRQHVHLTYWPGKLRNQATGIEQFVWFNRQHAPPLSARRSFTVHVSAPAPPTVSFPGLDTNGTFRFQVTGDPGPDYRVWGSNDLINWSILRTFPRAVPPFWFEDIDAKDHDQRFYKLELGP